MTGRHTAMTVLAFAIATLLSVAKPMQRIVSRSSSPPASSTATARKSAVRNSGIWPADNTHVVVARPDGQQLYVYSYDPSDFIYVVDTSFPQYPVIDAIPLPGVRPLHSYIAFSPVDRRAFISHALQCDFEESCNAWGDVNQIIVIDTDRREIEFSVVLPFPITPLESLVPSPDGKTLYFVAADWPGSRFGIVKLNLESRQVGAFVPLEGVNFLAISPDGKLLYATQGCNPWSNTTSVVELASMQVKTLNVGAGYSTVAIIRDGRKAYVTLPGTYVGFQFGNQVAVVDIAGDTVTGTITVHIEPQTIAMDPDGKRAYVSDGNANGPNPAEVHVIDVVNDSYLQPIILRPAARVMPTAIDITPDGKTLFVVSEAVENGRSHSRLLAVDVPTRALVASLAIQPRGVKVSYDGTRVYVFCEQQLLGLDRASLQTVMSVDLKPYLPAYPGYFDQASFRILVNRAGESAYLAGISKEVLVVDLIRGKVVAQIPFAEQAVRILGLALTPDERRLFVSDCIGNAVAVIDTGTNKVVARVALDSLPSHADQPDVGPHHAHEHGAPGAAVEIR